MITQSSAIEYTLAEPATGRLWREGELLQMELFATLVATLRGGQDVAPIAYQLRFTTGLTHAADADQMDSVVVVGAPAGSSRSVKLVGAATNRPDAFPGPGKAVYAVLSGSFDGLPMVP